MAPTLAEKIQRRFAEIGAGFVRDLHLSVVDAEPGLVRFVLPVSSHLTHAGGVLCGQAILTSMDAGMVFAMMSLNDATNVGFTTVQLQTSFERGVPADVGEATFEARVTKAGRTLVFGQIDLLLPDGTRAASATTTYMWI